MDNSAENSQRQLHEKLRLLGEILRLARIQPDLLAAEDLQGLTQSIEQRNRLMQDIETLNAACTASQAQHPDLTRQITAALDDIRRQDEQNIARASGLLQEYRTQLGQSGQTQRVLRGYAPQQGASGSVFLDKKQ